jgi:hypothetical protein
MERISESDGSKDSELIKKLNTGLDNDLNEWR